MKKTVLISLVVLVALVSLGAHCDSPVLHNEVPNGQCDLDHEVACRDGGCCPLWHVCIDDGLCRYVGDPFAGPSGVVRDAGAFTDPGHIDRPRSAR